MFFVDKEKKSSSSKVLTEAEIKKKLYGDFETTSVAGLSSVHDFKMGGGAFETEIPAARLRSAAPRPVTSSSSEVSATAQFQKHSSQASTKRSVDSAQFSDKPFRFSGIQNKLISVFGFLAGILWKVGSYGIGGLDLFLRVLDPRKPQARKVMYSLTACALVFILFFGVFRLNAQRKKAMLGEIPSTPSVTHPHKTAKSTAVVAAQAARPSSLTQAQKEESQEMILRQLEKSQTAVATLSAETTSRIEAATVPEGGKFVVQVATYATSQDAERVIQNLTKAGFQSFFKKQIRNSTGHIFYSVYLGRFESYTFAQQTLARFRKAGIARPFQDSFIRTLD